MFTMENNHTSSTSTNEVSGTRNKLSGTTISLPSFTESHTVQKLCGTISSVNPAIEEFRGIPYGTVPGRWQHSIIRDDLPNDDFDASKHGPKCPQPSEPNNCFVYQSELPFPDVGEDEFECLNLYISRPTEELLSRTGMSYEKHSLPVYFYIHGGGYGFGAGTDPMWDPTYLILESVRLKKPIMAVMINYRLNVFGFSASTEIIDNQDQQQRRRGVNFGIGDQRTALDWIVRNISAFGGNPTKITIGGQSAGSSSVHSHVLEAKFGGSNPLFRRAIMQSGAVGTIGPLKMKAADEKWSTLCNKVIEKFGDTGDPRLGMMMKKTSSELLSAAQDLGWWGFPLVQDNSTIKDRGNGRWVVNLGTNKSNENRSDDNNSEPLTVLMGDNEVEGVVFGMTIKGLETYQQVLDRLGVEKVGKHAGVYNILKAYDISGDSSAKEIFDQLVQFLGDVDFGSPIRNAWMELSTTPSDFNQPLEHEKPCPSRSKLYRVTFGNPWPGLFHNQSTHCVELIYTFDGFHDDLRRRDEKEEKEFLVSSSTASNDSLVKAMQLYWISFIADDEVTDHVSKETEVIVYDTDRKMRISNFEEDDGLKQRKQRLDILHQYSDTAQWISTRLRRA